MAAITAPPMPDPIAPTWIEFLEWLHLDGMAAGELRYVMEKPWKYEDRWLEFCEASR